jgi:hypothetical protein
MTMGNAPQRHAVPLVWACPGARGDLPRPRPGGRPAVVYGRHLTEQRFASLLASALASFGGSRVKARLRSCTRRPASIWMDTLPTSWLLVFRCCLLDGCLGCPLWVCLGAFLCGCGILSLSCLARLRFRLAPALRLSAPLLSGVSLVPLCN